VRLPLTHTFQLERARHGLVFTCEDCVHHDVAAGRCVHGYPDEHHRARAFEPAGALNGVFCKEFEID
jgi:hypothetical protein